MRKINLNDTKSVANARESMAKSMESVGIDANKSLTFNGGWFAVGTQIELSGEFGGIDKNGHITTGKEDTIYFGALTTNGKPIPVQHFATPKLNGNIALIGISEFDDANGVKQTRVEQGTCTLPLAQAFDECLEIEGNTLADAGALLQCLVKEKRAKFEYLGTVIQQMTTRKASSEVTGWTPTEAFKAGYKRTKKIHLWKFIG